ncbi:MAG: GxxExxY protein [Armatimonadetes bacterium]|nr:GxxExxY protein [Armatimonadota bacterium]
MDEYLIAEFAGSGYEAETTREIIGAAIEVHKIIGPGLLESAYQACLARELSLRRIPFKQQVALPLVYKGIGVDLAYRIDFIIRDKVVVELKATDGITPVFEAQLMTYLRLTDLQLGLLINFNVPSLKNGIRRIIL